VRFEKTFLIFRAVEGGRQLSCLLCVTQHWLRLGWFVEMDEAVWDHAVYSKNRERSLNEEIAESFFRRVLERAKPYLSDEHFTLDGTLIEAWGESEARSKRGEAGGRPFPSVANDRLTATRQFSRLPPRPQY
jgi:hypothetical protein